MPKPNTSQFKTISQELYKKNLELVNANKEMALVQKLYEVIVHTLEVNVVAQQFIDVVVKDLNFVSGLVALKTKDGKKLEIVARTKIAQDKKLFKLVGGVVDDAVFTLHKDENILTEVVKSGRRRVTHSVLELFHPLVNQEQAARIASLTQVKTIIAYPLIFAEENLGVFAISLDRTVNDLSLFEKEALKRVAVIFGVAINRVQLYQELQTATRSLRKANRRLKELDKLKDEFVSIASHELRTPMTAVKSYVWLAINELSSKGSKKEVKKYLNIAYDSTERLVHMVKDMLTISRIEGKRLEIRKTEVNFAEIINKVYDELKITADEKGVKFTFDNKLGEVVIDVDQDKMREVIQNIVGNALKFTPKKGAVTMTLVTKERAGKNTLCLSVTDTGPGIAAKDMKRLFQKFGKLEKSYENISDTGTGLGLYISKKIINLHKGRIEVTSTVGKGTTFTVSLPVKVNKKKGKEPHDKPQS